MATHTPSNYLRRLLSKSTNMHHQKIGSVTLPERIQGIDIIRGVALFGILIINFTVDYQPLDSWSEKPVLDQVIYWPITFFIDEKFRAIYSFLFGLGFSIQMLRAEASNTPFISVYMRRLIVLYLFGVANQILSGGDILHNYAMVGLILLLLYKIPGKLLPLLAFVCFFVATSRNYFVKQEGMQSTTQRNVITVDTTILDSYVGVYEITPGRRVIITREGNKLFGEGRGGKPQLIATSEKEFVAEKTGAHFSFKDSFIKPMSIAMHLPSGTNVIARKIDMEISLAVEEMNASRKRKSTLSYRQFVNKNADNFWSGLKNWSWKDFLWYGTLTETLPLFLLGLYFGRRKLFNNVASNSRFLKLVTKYGLIIGLLMVGIATSFSAWNYFNNVKGNSYSLLTDALIDICWNLGAIITAIAYTSGIALIVEKSTWKNRLSFFVAVGRMGLTNYLLQSAAVVLILSYGLRLYGLGIFGRFMLALPIFAIILFISRWWFRHFKMGPFEWLWRSLTYWKIQPMQLKPTNKSKEKENANI